MATKKSLTKAEETKALAIRKESDVVRVEESMEDFLRMVLPAVQGTRISICPLFVGKDGASYFRANYWKYVESGLLPSRTLADSRYVKIERTGQGYRFTDLTIKK